MPVAIFRFIHFTRLKQKLFHSGKLLYKTYLMLVIFVNICNFVFRYLNTYLINIGLTELKHQYIN